MISVADIPSARAMRTAEDVIAVLIGGKPYLRVHAPPDHADFVSDAAGTMFVPGEITREVATAQLNAWFTTAWRRFFESSVLRDEAETMADIAERCSSPFPEVAARARAVMEAVHMLD